jgi:hypothetical protein
LEILRGVVSQSRIITSLPFSDLSAGKALFDVTGETRMMVGVARLVPVPLTY